MPCAFFITLQCFLASFLCTSISSLSAHAFSLLFIFPFHAQLQFGSLQQLCTPCTENGRPLNFESFASSVVTASGRINMCVSIAFADLQPRALAVKYSNSATLFVSSGNEQCCDLYSPENQGENVKNFLTKPNKVLLGHICCKGCVISLGSDISAQSTLTSSNG